MTKYQDMRKKHQDEINAFEGIFWAFNNNQFKEGMEKIGLTVNDTNKISRLPSGGFILKEKVNDFLSMFKRHDDERQQLKKEEKELLSALVYELQNHEYCISYDINPALDALGFTKEEIDPKILKKACSLAV